MISLKRTAWGIVCGALLALSSMGPCAQDFPARAISIVVPAAPGGTVDINARPLAQVLTRLLGQSVIVENRGGLAVEYMTKQPADGYTLFLSSAALGVNATLYPKLNYDPVKDFAGITQMYSSAYLLVVPPSLGVKTARDLIAMAKAKPGALNFSSAGTGSGTHFASEVFKDAAKIDVVHVPYKGIPEAMNDTMTNRVQFFMAPIANAVPQVRDGKLLALGVSSLKRDALLPDVPTIADSGVPGYDAILWFGLVTTAKTPAPVIAELNREVKRILSEDDVKRRWAPIGLEPSPTTPEGFDKLIASDIATFTKLAKAGNIKAQ